MTDGSGDTGKSCNRKANRYNRLWLVAHRVTPHDVKVRPEGFEPPTLGSEDRCPVNVKAKKANRLRQAPLGEVPTVVRSSLHSDSGSIAASSEDPTPAQIAASWAHLPEAIRVEILALIQATGGADA